MSSVIVTQSVKYKLGANIMYIPKLVVFKSITTTLQDDENALFC